jgi:hypothetical protein
VERGNLVVVEIPLLVEAAIAPGHDGLDDVAIDPRASVLRQRKIARTFQQVQRAACVAVRRGGEHLERCVVDPQPQSGKTAIGIRERALEQHAQIGLRERLEDIRPGP